MGLTMLDEPAAKQSDPSVLELQLRAISKQSSAKSVQIRKIDSGEKSAKEIDKWIKDISDLHRSKPPPTVHYTKPMPDIDRLMQEWPPEVEEMLKETGIPTAGIVRSEHPQYVRATGNRYCIVVPFRVRMLHRDVRRRLLRPSGHPGLQVPHPVATRTLHALLSVPELPTLQSARARRHGEHQVGANGILNGVTPFT